MPNSPSPPKSWGQRMNRDEHGKLCPPAHAPRRALAKRHLARDHVPTAVRSLRACARTRRVCTCDAAAVALHDPFAHLRSKRRARLACLFCLVPRLCPVPFLLACLPAHGPCGRRHRLVRVARLHSYACGGATTSCCRCCHRCCGSACVQVCTHEADLVAGASGLPSPFTIHSRARTRTGSHRAVVHWPPGGESFGGSLMAQRSYGATQLAS